MWGRRWGGSGMKLSALQIMTDSYANSVDPDETARYEPSHQDLRCLQFCFFFFLFFVRLFFCFVFSFLFFFSSSSSSSSSLIKLKPPFALLEMSKFKD